MHMVLPLCHQSTAKCRCVCVARSVIVSQSGIASRNECEWPFGCRPLFLIPTGLPDASACRSFLNKPAMPWPWRPTRCSLRRTCALWFLCLQRGHGLPPAPCSLRRPHPPSPPAGAAAPGHSSRAASSWERAAAAAVAVEAHQRVTASRSAHQICGRRMKVGAAYFAPGRALCTIKCALLQSFMQTQLHHLLFVRQLACGSGMCT